MCIRDSTEGSGHHEPNTVSYDADNSLTIEQLKSDFTAMAKSVAKNGGFYTSRYEIGENETFEGVTNNAVKVRCV